MLFIYESLVWEKHSRSDLLQACVINSPAVCTGLYHKHFPRCELDPLQYRLLLPQGATSQLTLYFLKVIWIYEGFVQTALEISVVSGPPLPLFSWIHGTEGNFGFPISLPKCFLLAGEAPIWTACQFSLVCDKLPRARSAVGI